MKPLQRLCSLRAPHMAAQAASIASTLEREFKVKVSGAGATSETVKGAVLETLGSLLEAFPQVDDPRTGQSPHWKLHITAEIVHPIAAAWSNELLHAAEACSDVEMVYLLFAWGLAALAAKACIARCACFGIQRSAVVACFRYSPLSHQHVYLTHSSVQMC